MHAIDVPSKGSIKDGHVIVHTLHMLLFLPHLHFDKVYNPLYFQESEHVQLYICTTFANHW